MSTLTPILNGQCVRNKWISVVYTRKLMKEQIASSNTFSSFCVILSFSRSGNFFAFGDPRLVAAIGRKEVAFPDVIVALDLSSNEVVRRITLALVECAE